MSVHPLLQAVKVLMALVLICGAGGSSIVYAQTPPQPKTLPVTAGEPTNVTTEQKQFKIDPKPKYGKAETVSADPSGPFTLRYTPDKSLEAKTDMLSYTVEGGSPQQIIFNIAPAASGFSGAVYEESFKAIFLLFVLAILLESALAVLFNWRPFIEIFNARAVRPLVAFVVALIFIYIFDLDIVSSLINSIKDGKYPNGVPGKILTAMIVAGGSAGVNSMLIALGFRQVRTPETVAPKPPPDKAWISISALPGNEKGDLYVYVGPPPAAGAGDPPLLGVIKDRSKKNLLSGFFSDRGRLPNYGGHAVKPGEDYLIKVRGATTETTLGPFKFAAGSFIDVDVKL